MPAWELVPLKGNLGAWTATWDALNGELNGGHPLLDSRFVNALLGCFGRYDEILCVSRSSQVVHGLCILRATRPGLWSTFLPGQAPMGPVLLGRAAQLGELVRSLPGLIGAVDLLCLDPLFTPGEVIDGCPVRQLDHALTVNVDLSGSFDAYWADRSRNLAKNLRRYLNRLTNSGMGPRLERISEVAAMAEAVRRYGDLESRGWKGEQGTAIHADNLQGHFYRDVLEAFAATGQAVVYEYWIGDKLAASRLNITSQGMLVILKTAYDENLAEFAPGRLLLHALIADQFALGSRQTIEFYTNANDDQLAWATGQRRIRHLTVYRNAWVKRAHGLLTGRLRP